MDQKSATARRGLRLSVELEKLNAEQANPDRDLHDLFVQMFKEGGPKAGSDLYTVVFKRILCDKNPSAAAARLLGWNCGMLDFALEVIEIPSIMGSSVPSFTKETIFNAKYLHDLLTAFTASIGEPDGVLAVTLQAAAEMNGGRNIGDYIREFRFDLPPTQFDQKEPEQPANPADTGVYPPGVDEHIDFPEEFTQRIEGEEERTTIETLRLRYRELAYKAENSATPDERIPATTGLREVKAAVKAFFRRLRTTPPGPLGGGPRFGRKPAIPEASVSDALDQILPSNTRSGEPVGLAVCADDAHVRTWEASLVKVVEAIPEGKETWGSGSPDGPEAEYPLAQARSLSKQYEKFNGRYEAERAELERSKYGADPEGHKAAWNENELRYERDKAEWDQEARRVRILLTQSLIRPQTVQEAQDLIFLWPAGDIFDGNDLRKRIPLMAKSDKDWMRLADFILDIHRAKVDTGGHRSSIYGLLYEAWKGAERKRVMLGMEIAIDRNKNLMRGLARLSDCKYLGIENGEKHYDVVRHQGERYYGTLLDFTSRAAI